MSTFITALDAMLALALVGVAARAVNCSDLFEAVSLFIAFALLMTLAWVRLDAVDVALAEAAIGSGFTGALFLAGLGRLLRQQEQRRARDDER